MNVILSLYLSFAQVVVAIRGFPRVRDSSSPGPSQGAAVAWDEAGSAPGSEGTGAAVA